MVMRALHQAALVGLIFDAAARTISGTPTVAADAATYTWTVSDGDANTDSDDAATLTFEVMVNEAVTTPTRVTGMQVEAAGDGALTVSWTADGPYEHIGR